jgi:hypothetical protein
MSELDTVQGYLQNLRAEGEIQSRGRFTLDPKQSRVKIAEMQRQDLSGWACWWVRAGVCLGAESGSIQCGRDLVTARFAFAHGVPGFEQAGKFLRLGDDGADGGGVELLRSALLWTQSLLETRPTLEAALLLETPGEPILSLRLRAEGVELQHAPQLGQQPSLSLNLQDTRPQRPGGGELLPLRLALATKLPPRVAFCPIPLMLDGVLLNSGAPAVDNPPLVFLRYYLCPPSPNVLAVKDPRCWPARHYRLDGTMPRRFSRQRLSSPASRVNTLSLAGELHDGAAFNHTSGVPLLKWRGGFPEQLFLQGQVPLHAQGWSIEEYAPWLVRAALFRGDSGVNEWAVVHEGLRLDWEPLSLTQSGRDLGWRAIVGMSRVGTDISGVRALQSEAFTRVEEWLRGEIVDLHRRQNAELRVGR